MSTSRCLTQDGRSLGFQGWLPSRGQEHTRVGQGEKAQASCRLATRSPAQGS